MSETTNLKLFKHDNPSTNTNPFDVEQALNDNWDKIDTVVGEMQEEQTTQNEDIESLQEENANLKAQIPQGQAAGEEINLQDSAKMELVEFGLQGNSRQETREGYNLANYNTSADSSTLNFQIGNITTGKTYSLFLYVPVGKISFNLRYNTGAGTTILTDWNMTGKIIKTFTAEEDAILYFNGFSQSEDYEGISEIMLLEGTYTSENLPAYEEYGAMPSLNYPSEVEAVGDSGSVEIVKSNKNLLNLDYRNANGIAFDKNRITVVNPTSYNNGIDSKLIKNKFLCGKNISVKIISNGSVVSGYAPSLVISTNKDAYRFQKVYKVNNYNNEVTNITRQFSEDEYISGIQFYTNYSQGGTKCNLTIDVQIEISDESTEFIEHEGNTYTIPVQKPFLKGDYFIKEDNHWKEVHLREKRNIKDDIENATLSSTNNFIYVSNLLLNIAQPITNEVDANVLSNVLNHATYNEMYAGSVDYGIGISQVGSLTIRINGLTTLEEYKNALNSEDYYYYFFLANPEKIECTEEQTQILEQIVKDGTYKGITHFYTTEDLKPTIEVKYYKDIETLFKNQASMQETLNNVQAQILELGGN